MTDWISVEERLPEFGIHVLICQDGDITVGQRMPTGLTDWMDIWEGELYMEPTHWMPLPEGPK